MIGVAFANFLSTAAAPLKWEAKFADVSNLIRTFPSALQFSTSLDANVGGDREASFQVPAELSRSIPITKGMLMFVYDGGDNVLWAGRVTETPRAYNSGAGEYAQINAKGLWQELMDRLIDAALTMTNTSVSMPIDYYLRRLGVTVPVACDLQNVDEQSADIGTLTTTAYAQYSGGIIQQEVAYGDSQAAPAPLAFTVSGWKWLSLGLYVRSHFYTANKPPSMGDEKVGAATITYGSGGTAVLINTTIGADVTDAAIVYDNTMIQRLTLARDSTIRIDMRWMTGTIQTTSHPFMLIARATIPVINTAAAWDAQTITEVRQANTGRVYFVYRDDTLPGVQYYWDPAGGVWDTPVTYYAGGAYTYYVLCYEHDPTNGFRYTMFDATGATMLVQTAWVPWNIWTAKNTNQLWWVTGDPDNDAEYAQTTVDYYRRWGMVTGGKPSMKTLSVTDYDFAVNILEAPDFQMNNPDESIANFVAASYSAGPSYYTTSDATSIARYGQRDVLIAAGTSADLAAATRLAVKKLAESKAEVWRGSAIRVTGMITRKGGARVPVYTVKAGDRVKVTSVNFPDGLTFVVGSVSYDVDSDAADISPLDMPDSIEAILARKANK